MIVLAVVHSPWQKQQTQWSETCKRRLPFRCLQPTCIFFLVLCCYLLALHHIARPALVLLPLVDMPPGAVRGSTLAPALTTASEAQPRIHVLTTFKERPVDASLAIPEEMRKAKPHDIMFGAMQKQHTSIATDSGTFTISSPPTQTGARVREAAPRPSLQVFLVTAPANEVYRERYLANARGWHREFPDLQVFTFDEIPTNITSFDGSSIRRIQRLPIEEHNKGTNLLLAAFGAIYEYNPNADYYFLTEDDTVLVKKNIDEAVQRLARRKDVYIGKCVRIKTQTLGLVDFIMGGPGVLMSGDMLRRMAPGILQCRKDYNKFQHGDVRIAACLRFMNVSYSDKFCDFPELQLHGGLHFTSMSAWRAASIAEVPEGKVVTLHEKQLTRIKVLNDAINDLGNQKQDITWESLKPYLDKFAANRTDKY